MGIGSFLSRYCLGVLDCVNGGGTFTGGGSLGSTFGAGFKAFSITSLGLTYLELPLGNTYPIKSSLIHYRLACSQSPQCYSAGSSAVNGEQQGLFVAWKFISSRRMPSGS